MRDVLCDVYPDQEAADSRAEQSEAGEIVRAVFERLRREERMKIRRGGPVHVSDVLRELEADDWFPQRSPRV